MRCFSRRLLRRSMRLVCDAMMKVVGGQLFRGDWNERMKNHKHEIQTDDDSVAEQSCYT